MDKMICMPYNLAYHCAYFNLNIAYAERFRSGTTLEFVRNKLFQSIFHFLQALFVNHTLWQWASLMTFNGFWWRKYGKKNKNHLDHHTLSKPQIVMKNAYSRKDWKNATKHNARGCWQPYLKIKTFCLGPSIKIAHFQIICRLDLKSGLHKLLIASTRATTHTHTRSLMKFDKNVGGSEMQTF